MVSFEPNLRVGESQWSKPGRRVGLISQAIASLLGRRAVVAEPISLNN
jgi:hypothetical protein